MGILISRLLVSSEHIKVNEYSSNIKIQYMKKRGRGLPKVHILHSGRPKLSYCQYIHYTAIIQCDNFAGAPCIKENGGKVFKSVPHGVWILDIG